VLTRLVVPLMRASFYATEIDRHPTLVFYYRVPVWCRLQELAHSSLTTSVRPGVHPVYVPLSGQERRMLQQQQQQSTLMPGSMRLLPKTKGIRPIVNLARRPPAGLSVNTQLQDVLAVLNLECKQQPHRLGASVFAPRQLYERLIPFHRAWVERGKPPLFWVSADVRAAFDTLSQVCSCVGVVRCPWYIAV
jgi:telomerase reverse transcriptase